jgi:hypothetical protein
MSARGSLGRSERRLATFEVTARAFAIFRVVPTGILAEGRLCLTEVPAPAEVTDVLPPQDVIVTNNPAEPPIVISVLQPKKVVCEQLVWAFCDLRY